MNKTEKITAFSGSIKWNNSTYNPELIICFRRKENTYDKWYEIHIKLTPDITRDISSALKSYVNAWWKSQRQTLLNIGEYLNL